MQNSFKKANRRIPKPPVGWPLLPAPKNGTLSYPTLENSIKQYIKIILLTRPGEQLMRPQFGAGLAQFLHQSNTLETRQQIQDTVLDALSEWEERVLVDRVEVREDEKPDTLCIEIAYRVKRTGEKVSTMVKMNLGN